MDLSIVNQSASPQAKIALFRTLFRGREDVYPDSVQPQLHRFDSCRRLPSHQSMSSEVLPSYRYIVRTSDVRDGHARVDGTRIAVHDVIGLLQNGETVDSVTGSCLPALTKSQVYECLAYYEDHRGEIDLLVARQMSEAPDQR